MHKLAARYRNPPAWTRWTTLWALFLLGGPSSGAGQIPHLVGLPTLGGEVEDRLRLAQLLGEEDIDGFLLRTPSSLLSGLLSENGQYSLSILAPEVRGIHNSDLPFSFNDGTLWAGRGFNSTLTFGVRFKAGPVTVVLAPEWTYAENRPFQIIPYPPNREPEREFYANPFHAPPESMDYPMRFGKKSIRQIGPGQSSLTVTAGPAAFGVSTESTWWGPGVRNGIILSDNAPGIPRAFLRSATPLRTPWGGEVEATWILGQLEESDYFDENRDNNHRSFSGIAMVLRPTAGSGFSIGMARTVFAPLGPEESPVGAAFDAFKSVGRPNRLEAEQEPEPGPDQILSIFSRWVFAPHGFEVYGEWVRFEEPGSFRDFLEFPQHTQGYTFGLQWVKPLAGEGKARFQAEQTNLEPSGTWRFRKPFSSYSSRVEEHGYTNRGQVVGAAIGPGASSQWLAGDYLAPRWRVGAVAGRVRWDAASWLSGEVNYWGREDVSVFWGLRGGGELFGWDLTGEVLTGVRINYLFQTFRPDPLSGQAEGVDIGNTSVSMTLSKSLWR